MNKKTDKTYLFESASVARAVWTMAIPTVVTQLMNIVYNFADTWYVGRTANPAMVATLGVCFPIFVIMAAVANLFGIGGSSMISRGMGSGDLVPRNI
ncbi:MAG: MATE family efflux transporter [Lachnospiraceae bacterium]|nr:MATE family efflux transporter [Lachnospiraceae bacterium]